MKTQILGAIIIIAAGTAQAQSAWEGAYVGGSISGFSGEDDYPDSVGEVKLDLEGQMLGAFGGYNASVNGFIVGGEVALSSGAVNEEGAEDEYEYTSLIDLKGRVGFDSGAFMPYAVLGASFGTFAVDDDSAPDRDFDQTETGILFGVGADYAINDQFTVGAEIVSRSFEFEFPEDADLADMEGTVNSFSLRGSYRF